MKNQVIKFLGDLPKSGSEQFNQALDHFRKSKNHDPEKLRYYNALGFSKDRLESLLYELKKIHSITDTEVAMSKIPLTPKGGIEPSQEEIITDVRVTLKNSDRILAMELEAAIGLYEDLGVKIKNIKEEDIPEDVKQNLYSFGSFLAQCREAAAQEEYKDLKLVNDLILAYQELVKKQEVPLAPEGGISNVSNDTKKETLEITSEELGTKELSEKVKEHISVNQIDVNDSTNDESPLTPEGGIDDAQEEVILELGPSEEFKQKLADFDLETEKYNSIKSFAAEVSNETEVDPVDQKAATLKAFIAEAKKKLTLS